VSSSGVVTLSSALDYESTTSYDLTLSASDGTNTVTANLTINVTDVDLSLSASLASSSQSENVSTGTTIASSSVSNTEGAVTYSLTDADNKFAINSSTGEVTLANALDYETKTSHEFTVTANDGVTTTSQTFTLSVSDAGVEDLAVTLANSGAALAESSSSGTAVASSSISNPENISISYSLSGTGSSNFAVDSSGNVTTNANLDFETAKSYSLTLTASGGGSTLTDSFTVNVGNTEELESAVLRYSAAFNSASRSGFSATATRGQSGSSLPAYFLEQVGTTNTTDITSVFVPGNGSGTVGYVPVQIDSGTALNWRYYFPISHANFSKYSFHYGDTWSVSNSSHNRLVGYKGNLGTPVSTELVSGETITGGRLENGEYWFWVTDKAAADITYESAAGTSSTYNLYEDQVTLAGEVYKDANFTSFTNGNKRVIAMVMIPVDKPYVGSTSNRYFLPNFIPSNFWSYDTVGLDYCQGVGNSVSACTSTSSRWSLIKPTLDTESSQPGHDSSDRYPIIGTSRFYAPTNSSIYDNELPEGMSMWWQVLNPNGVGVGLWAQISFKDSYTGGEDYSSQNKPRDDQQSLLNVVISNIDNRKNDTTRYSAGDTGLGMEGYHYWSYQGATNADNNGLGVTYGTSPIECATSSDSGCFWGDTSNQPGGAMLTSSDPYKSGNMTVGVNYNSNNDTFSTGTFNTSAVLTDFWGPLAISGIRLDSSSGRKNFFLENTNCTDSTCAIHSLENGDAFAVSILFYLPVGASDETIPLWGTRWSSGNGNVDSGEVFMRIVNGKIVFQGGRQGSNTLTFEGDDTLTEGKWYGLYFTYDGSTLVSWSQWDSMTIKLVDPLSGVVTTVEGTDTNANQPNQWFTGSANKRYYVGTNGAASTDDDQLIVANNIMTTLIVGSPQSDAEIAMMITDPKQWVTDYKIGETARLSESSVTFTFALEDENSRNATRVYVFGDSDTYYYQNNDMMVFNYIDLPERHEVWNYPIAGTYATAIAADHSIPNADVLDGASSLYGDPVETCCTAKDYKSISDFRNTDFYASTATTYEGFFSGLMEFDVSGTGNGQLASVRSNSTLASFTFDTTNDDVQVVVPMTISAAPSNNYTSNWSTVDTGSMTLKFGDATNDEAKSAYISSEVFGAEIQDDGAQIDGSAGGSNNLAGVMVSYNTLEKEDSDLFHENGNDSMPNTDYSTWGFWAMSAVDVSPNAGTQNASVHLGTWVGGEVVAQNEIPTSGSASMAGAAVMNVAYRYNQTGTNYDVHKYTTTADVGATFNWGASGYSGTLAFTNFDDKNPIVDNAGFASFSVAITGTDHTYTGDSTDTLDNSWLGGASVAGALYGGSSPQESGGRVNVSLYKTGDIGTAGANDFYMAEGIYLVDCTSGTCQ